MTVPMSAAIPIPVKNTPQPQPKIKRLSGVIKRGIEHFVILVYGIRNSDGSGYNRKVHRQKHQI